jgi:hypothetical protein
MALPFPRPGKNNVRGHGLVKFVMKLEEQQTLEIPVIVQFESCYPHVRFRKHYRSGYTMLLQVIQSMCETT